MPKQPPFPLPSLVRNGRNLWVSTVAENYKRSLLGLPPINEDTAGPIEFIDLATFANQLSCSARTIHRRLVETRAALALKARAHETA